MTSMRDEQDALVQQGQMPRLIAVWVLAAVLALGVLLFAPSEQRAEWIACAIGAIVLVSFVLQLGTGLRERFITRLSFSVVGGAVVIGAAHAVSMLVGV